MLKKPTNGQSNGSPKSTYAYGPDSIGAVLKQRAEALKLEPPAIATALHIERESVYRIFKRKRLSFPQLLAWSELLGENYLLLYHPNVKPLPDPQQEENDKLKALLKHLEGVENENALLKNRCTKLEAKIEVLEEQLSGRNGR